MVVNWISVELRMPEDGRWLVTVQESGGRTFTGMALYLGDSMGSDGEFFPGSWSLFAGNLGNDKVTHWADMPQPAQSEPIQVGATYTRAELERDGIETISFEANVSEYTLETQWHVKGHGVYGRGSVLEGQQRKVHLDTFATLKAAKAAYPFDDITQGATGPSTAEVPHCPPSDWSPDDAGEHWGEDDY